jgi:formamidopyrimidine-DNA glycosylase
MAAVRATLGGVPEMLEVELYRRSLLGLRGGEITRVTALDPWWCRDAPDLEAAVRGRHVVDVHRHGKVLLMATDGVTIGLRFGMTGRLVVGGVSAVAELVYGAHGDDPSWRRVELVVSEAVVSESAVRDVVGAVVVSVSDPRRLGRVELDPDLTTLGPDAWGISAATLQQQLGSGVAAIKVALLDQHRVAGLGNMLADEVLLRAGIAPTRRCRDVATQEWRLLADAVADALPDLLAAGGSHAGLLSSDLRRDGAPCPLDGASMQRTVLAGRSSFHCPAHQR